MSNHSLTFKQWDWLNFSLVAMMLYLSLAPYLSQGVRLDHLLTGLLFFYSSILLIKLPQKDNKLLQLTVTTAGILFLAAMVCLSLSTIQIGLQNSLSFIRPLGRLLIPPLQFFSFLIILRHLFLTQGVQTSIKRTVQLLISAGVIASSILVFSLIWTPESLTNGITSFDPTSIWFEARSLGRHTGIFIQPLEAGLFYSLMLCISIYALEKAIINNHTFLLLLSIFTFSGNAGLSKNFYIVGFSLSIVLVLFTNNCSKIKTITTMLAVHTVSLTLILSNAHPVYLNSLSRLIFKDGVVSFLSGGRLEVLEGQDINQNNLLAESGFALLKNAEPESFFLGFGLGKTKIWDSGYLEYYIQGGIIALLLYLMSIFSIAHYGLKSRKTAEGKILILLSLFALVASTGGPVLNASRAGVFYIFIVCFFLALTCRKSKEHPSPT